MSESELLLIELDKAEAADSGQRVARDRFYEAIRKESEIVKERLKLAEMGKGDFTPYELLFAARFRCACGAGMAYPEGIGMHGAWYCSAILQGQADAGTEHTPSHPFAFYEVKSEAQISGGGATTRPEGTHIEIEPTYACHNCGNTGKTARHRVNEPEKEDIVCTKCGARYLNKNGSGNPKMRTRYLHVVVAD